MNNLTNKRNHKLSQDLLAKAIENTNDWYSEEVKKSNMELLEWLFEREREAN